jgi:dTDP-glucose 4,6-dehydratase
VIHAATDASAALNQNSPDTMYDVIVAGTERVLEYCQSCEAQNLLFVSSGAVYASQPPGTTHLHEDFAAPPDAPARSSAYGEGKRVAENLCMESHARSGLSITLARCFCFVGPHFPLDRHFAIGNFLRDALAGRPIAVRDGRPFRSYMYAADLVTWLWTMLVRGGSCRPYNVGSDRAISIAELARQIADMFRTSVDVQGADAIATPQQPYYVPDTRRAHDEFGLTIETDLPDAITRTFNWYSQQPSMDGYKDASC